MSHAGVCAHVLMFHAGMSTIHGHGAGRLPTCGLPTCHAYA